MAIKSRAGLFLAALAAAGLFSGCAVGPDFRRPEKPSVEGYMREPLPAKTASTSIPGGEEQRFLFGRDIPADWWRLFRSPQLNALVQIALKSNPSVQVAQAALRQARELVYAQQGYYYPNVQAGLSSSRQRASATLSPPLNSEDVLFSLHTAQVSVGYTPDIFGALRRQVESIEAQANSQRFQLEATYLTLASNIVATAVQEAGLHARIAAAEKIIEINAKSLELLWRQFGAGLIAGTDVAAQEAALAQARQALPPLQKQLQQTRNLLAALSGRFPAEWSEEPFDLSALSLPEELPVSIPSRLVEQRPDVRAAEELLRAASAEVGVATANMLPQFTITALKGGTATHFSQMFANGNPFWSIAGSVAQTVFAGGTLLHRKRAAEAAFEQAAAQYRSTVIGAFQNVADALYALQADAEALSAAVKSETAARASLDIVSKQLQFGQVNYLALLNAQQTYQQAVNTVNDALVNRYSDTAALFLALGGGWWNRPESPAPSDAAQGPGIR